MAVTKIKPIRGTVNKALAYILNPQKTDDSLLCLLYTSPSPRDRQKSRMPSSA